MVSKKACIGTIAGMFFGVGASVSGIPTAYADEPSTQRECNPDGSPKIQEETQPVPQEGLGMISGMMDTVGFRWFGLVNVIETHCEDVEKRLTKESTISNFDCSKIAKLIDSELQLDRYRVNGKNTFAVLSAELLSLRRPRDLAATKQLLNQLEKKLTGGAPLAEVLNSVPFSEKIPLLAFLLAQPGTVESLGNYLNAQKINDRELTTLVTGLIQKLGPIRFQILGTFAKQKLEGGDTAKSARVMLGTLFFLFGEQVDQSFLSYAARRDMGIPRADREALRAYFSAAGISPPEDNEPADVTAASKINE